MLKESIPLKDNEKVRCRGCGRGEFRNSSDLCEACPDGFYQENDNQLMELDKIKSCKSCPAGHFAQKIKEYTKFEEWPAELLKFCNTATPAGNPLLCDSM